MTDQNLFEKYGIKEVADVTFYRIEKKNQNYEVQRKIPISSVLKGIMSTQMVYPMSDEGIGEEEGFEAFVFNDASIITGTNYDCDDEILVKETYTITFNTTKEEDIKLAAGLGHSTKPSEEEHEEAVSLEQAYEDFQKGKLDWNDKDLTVTDFTVKRWNTSTGEMLTDADLIDYKAMEDSQTAAVDTFKNTTSDGVLILVKVEKIEDEESEDGTKYNKTYHAVYTVNTVYQQTIDIAVGTNPAKEKKTDYPDFNKIPGTHEYSYPKQACMIFAKEQNLITKVGARYSFPNADDLFDNITFDDAFATAPNSSERVVVIGLIGKITAGGYNLEDVREAVNALTTSIEAKAYDVTYKNYAELVVEDEMGYYRPDFLGVGYKKKADGTAYLSNAFDKDESENVDPEDNDNGHSGRPDEALKEYKEWAAKHRGIDSVLANAYMWGDQEHYSINDAIDALRQRRLNIDVNIDESKRGVRSIFGGYRVGKNKETYRPRIGNTDQYNRELPAYREQHYTYHIPGASTTDAQKWKSIYTLQSVLDTLAEMAMEETIDGLDIRADVAHATNSNRAIYVNTISTKAGAGAHIYILTNKAAALAKDTDGIFEFEDRMGNTLYYQDKIFAGVETLALVIIGNKGLIFVVNRWDNKTHDKVAWMVNDSGYITDSEAELLVKNGLIHTVTVTDYDESFDATCEVKSIKVRKVNKTVNHYIPVLYLDTLKITTIDQTAEVTYATGGRGNANLIGWDYGKEITLSIEDALFTPASMSAMWSGGTDFVKGVKDTKRIDRMEKCVAKRSFIVPAGNSKGTPTEGETSAEAVYYDPRTMEPYQDGTPITEGEMFLKWTRSVAYEGQSIGRTIEISADQFPGVYKVVGETYARNKDTGEDQRFQFVISQAKMDSERSITLEADGDPSVNSYLSNADVKVA